LEFALIVPLLMMVLLGTVTTGLVYSDHLAVTNAAREGSRFGASADAGLGTWATSVQTRVQEVYFNANGSSPSNDQICVKLITSAGAVLHSDGGSSCGSEPSSPTNMAAGSCVVKVWMTKPARIQLVVKDLDLTLGAQSVAYYGRVLTANCTAK
jgi:hypothetical protein